MAIEEGIARTVGAALITGLTETTGFTGRTVSAGLTGVEVGGTDKIESGAGLAAGRDTGGILAGEGSMGEESVPESAGSSEAIDSEAAGKETVSPSNWGIDSGREDAEVFVFSGAWIAVAGRVVADREPEACRTKLAANRRAESPRTDANRIRVILNSAGFIFLDLRDFPRGTRTGVRDEDFFRFIARQG